MSKTDAGTKEPKRNADKAVYDTLEEWHDEARRRFGPDMMKWAFVCPVCGYAATVQDWKDAGSYSEAVAFSCVGRWKQGSKKAFGSEKLNGGPCDYTGGGLFRLNPITVAGVQAFDFAPATVPQEVAQ